MHIESAIISTAVAGAVAVSQVGAFGYAAKQYKKEKPVDRLSVASAGAFVFSAQMINVSIAGTGASGHFTGGMLLSYLFGPKMSFMVMSLILTLQSLLFGDGGLLALGCNVFNMAFIPSFIVYPLLIKPLLEKDVSTIKRLGVLSLACIVALQLGAFAVVLQTSISGVSGIAFTDFLMRMQPIHLAIGIMEGAITFACVAAYEKSMQCSPLVQSRPDVLNGALFLMMTALIGGGVLSVFASANPDGLEWSIAQATNSVAMMAPDATHAFFDGIQSKTALLVDYAVPGVQSVFATCLAGLSGCTVVFLAVRMLMPKNKVVTQSVAQ